VEGQPGAPRVKAEELEAEKLLPNREAEPFRGRRILFSMQRDPVVNATRISRPASGVGRVDVILKRRG